MSKWRVRKGADLEIGWTLRFGNVTRTIVNFEYDDEFTYVNTRDYLGNPGTRFRLDSKQSYRVLVDEDNRPMVWGL